MTTATKIILYVVNPFLLVVLIVVTFQFLQVEQERLDNRVDTNNSVRAASKVDVVPLKVSEWEPYYSGGQGIDTVITRSGQAVRVSTGADGEWYGARANINNKESLNEYSVSFAVYVDNWEALDRLILMFSTDKDFSSYVGFNLLNYFSDPADGEWNEIVVERSVFETIDGNPNWSDINTVGIRVVPKPGFATRVWFDQFNLIAEESTAPTISFTFDDGFASVIEAATILDEYDYEATVFVIPRLLGTTTYMSQTNVDKLHEMGWDIGGHSNLKLTELIAPDVDTELALTLAYLKENDYRGGNHFAYPNGAYNESVASQVHEYFTSARTIDGFSQPSEYTYSYKINAITVASSTPVTEITRAVDQAIADNTWLILVWHDLNTEPIQDIEYHIEDFRWLVKYINSKGVTVEPYSVAYERLTK